MYGPYGKESGHAFASLPNGKVLGFFGRSGTLLDQIGILMHDHSSISASIPGESSSEVHPKIMPTSGKTTVASMSDGNGNMQQKITLYSSKEKSGSFSNSVEKGEPISNREGHAHKDNNGLKSEHWYNSEHSEDGLHEEFYDRVTVENDVGKLVSEDNVRVHGPWGGLGGDAFCDGRGEIVEILVAFDAKQVISLQVSYAHGSSTFKGTVHGGCGGNTAEVSNLLLCDYYICY